MIEQIPIYSIVKWCVKWLPGLLLRKYYTKDRLAGLIYFDFLPRSESALVDLGQAATVRLAFQIINLTPFSVQLDRANFRFWGGGAEATLSSLERKELAPGTISQLFLAEPLVDGHANQIAQAGTNPSFWLDANLEFNCKVQAFQKIIRAMDNIQVSFLNRRARPDHA